MRCCLVVVMGMLGTGLSARTALAQPRPSIQVLEPASMQLFYEDVPIDSASAPQRIRLRNVGDGAVQFIEVNLPGFYEVVATEGDLGPGGEQSWDIACVPGQTDLGSDFLDIILCADGCEIEIWETFIVQCDAGLLSAPSPDVFVVGVYQGQEWRATIPISNPQSEPLTITALETAAPFSAALETGSLPETVQPGESVGVVVEFDTTAPDTQGTLDIVVAGGLIAERLRVYGSTIKQISPATWNFELVPQGAVHTVPIEIHNPSSVQRAITSASFDSGEFSVSDLVGAIVPPNQSISALVSVAASTLGPRSGALTVTFDAEPLAIAWFSATVVPGTFSVLTADSAVGDGWLDFGARQPGSPSVERSVTVVNNIGADRIVFGCSSHLPPFELLGCPSSIPAGGTAEFVMRFTPGAVGPARDNLRIGIEADGGADAFVIVVPVRARVVDRPYELSAQFLAFADTVIGTTSQRTVTITNLGAFPISLPVAVRGDAFALIGPDTITVPGDGGAEVAVEFRPDGAGEFSGSLEVGAPDDPDRISIPLSGRVPSSKIACDEQLDFGDVEVGTTAEGSVTLRNLDPEGSYEIGELTIDGDGFSAVTPEVSTLGPGASVDITLQFSPASAGAATGQLAIELAGTGAAQAVVTLLGRGVLVDPDPDGDDGDEADGGDDGDSGDGDPGDDEETGACTAGRGQGGHAALLTLLLILGLARRRRPRGPSTRRG